MWLFFLLVGRRRAVRREVKSNYYVGSLDEKQNLASGDSAPERGPRVVGPVVHETGPADNSL
jgi:hypothetical protein